MRLSCMRHTGQDSPMAPGLPRTWACLQCLKQRVDEAKGATAAACVYARIGCWLACRLQGLVSITCPAAWHKSAGRDSVAALACAKQGGTCICARSDLDSREVACRASA